MSYLILKTARSYLHSFEKKHLQNVTDRQTDRQAAVAGKPNYVFEKDFLKSF